MILCLFILLRMRNISGKNFKENRDTHFLFNNFIYFILFFLENSAVYETIRINIVELERPHMTIWRMRIPCCVRKATNTHLEYIIRVAFPLQKWLHEHASMLLFVCIALSIL